MTTVLIDSLPIMGGGQRMLARIGECLADRSPLLVRPLDAPEEDAVHGMPVRRMRFPRYRPAASFARMVAQASPRVLMCGMELARLFAAHRPEIVIANDLYSLAPLLFARCAGPAPILYVHSRDLPRRSGPLLDRCSGIIACSRAAAEALPATRTPVHIVHNAVPPPATPLERDGWREALGWQGDWVCGFVGRLDANKNAVSLVRAFSAALPRLDRPSSLARLLIIGDGEERASIAAAAMDAGIASRVHLLGWRQDAARAMAELDALALPSLDEALPLSLIEGQTLGLAVMGSRRGGIPEIIDDGRTGILAASPSEQDLSEALLRLRGIGPGHPMRAAAKGEARSRFSPERYRTALAEALRRLHRGESDHGR